MSLSPRVIALLGFGEAGSAIARGLCADGGWRGAARSTPAGPGDNAPRRLIAIMIVIFVFSLCCAAIVVVKSRRHQSKSRG